MERLKPYLKYLYIPLCFLSLVGNALWFQWMYRGYVPQSWWSTALALILGWSLILTGVALVLPRTVKRVYMGVVGLVFFLLTVVHGIYFNMFRKLFSFSDLAFAGDGFAFLDGSYMVIRKLAILLGLLCLGLMVCAIVLVPRDEPLKPRLFRGVGTAAAGGLAVALACAITFPGTGTVIWDMATDPSAIYESFTDTKACMRLMGLYHYTFRDIQLALFPSGGDLSAGEREEIAAFAAERSHEDNAMTGALAGKNLILIQLEAIDTWMVDYMPNLKALKEEGLSFTNHYTPAYITAGTFNTEFMVNTGLFPAATGTTTGVYTHNSYPYSLPRLFQDRGYTANSFHGSEGDVYNRGAIHAAWGYTYHSGSDMGMDNYMMDSQLSQAFDAMTADAPFFSFVITYSGHGPYGEDNAIYQAHAQAAQAQATRTDGNYVYAVAHAMETDLFLGELMDYLERQDLLDTTTVVLYADHYNYYMMNDALNMIIKEVDSLNMLQNTDWIIWDKDLGSGTVDKYTSSLDVLPTLANLFGLEADYVHMAGDDAFSPDGGYVIFNDNTWTGTDADVSAQILLRRRISALILRGDFWRNS